MVPTTDVLAAVLADMPQIAAVLESAHEAAWASTDPVTLELCRVRIAQLLRNADELASTLDPALDPALEAAVSAWPPSPLLRTDQLACLAFAEEFVLDVASLRDATAAAVVAELGEQGFVDFLTALLVIEQRQRMRLAWSRLFPEVFA